MDKCNEALIVTEEIKAKYVVEQLRPSPVVSNLVVYFTFPSTRFLGLVIELKHNSY